MNFIILRQAKKNEKPERLKQAHTQWLTIDYLQLKSQTQVCELYGNSDMVP